MRARLDAVRRIWRTLFLVGFQAAPGLMTIAVVVAVVVAVASVAYSLGYRVIVNAVLAGHLDEALGGAAFVALLFSAQWGLSVYGNLLNQTVRDLCNVRLSSQISSLINGIPGVEHFERPDYLRELDLLQQNRLMISNGPRQSLGLVQIVVRSATIVILLATIYPPLALLPLLAVFAFLGDDRAARLQERTDRAVAEPRRLVGELFWLASTAARANELRTFGLQEELQRRHHEIAADVRRRAVRTALVGSLWSAGGWLVYGAGSAGAIAVLVVRAVHGEASVGDVVLAVSLIRRAQQQVATVSDSVGQLITIGRASRHLLWLEDRAREATDERASPGSVPSTIRHGIDVTDLSFAYPGTDHQVLGELSLHVPAGAVVAIVGENGAGKTTLVKLLTAMYRPTGGSISVDGVDLRAMDTVEWRSRTTAAFQDFVSFQLRVGDVVGIGDLPRVDDPEAVTTALERAQAADVPLSLPHGIETPLGWSMEGGHELSGGQWQKLAIGRAMMRDEPLLMLLDEPTASLDALTEATLFDRYITTARRRAATSGTITVLVSHRFSTVRMADLIVVLHEGRIQEMGSHDELVRMGGLYAELFELQARSYR